MTTHAFIAEVVHPLTQQLEDCEVKYRMVDTGTDLWPVIISVSSDSTKDILQLLDPETISNIEGEAALQYAEE